MRLPLSAHYLRVIQPPNNVDRFRTTQETAVDKNTALCSFDVKVPDVRKIYRTIKIRALTQLCIIWDVPLPALDRSTGKLVLISLTK